MKRTVPQFFRLTVQDDLNLEIILAKTGKSKQDLFEALAKRAIKAGVKGLGELLEEPF